MAATDFLHEFSSGFHLLQASAKWLQNQRLNGEFSPSRRLSRAVARATMKRFPRSVVAASVSPIPRRWPFDPVPNELPPLLVDWD